MALAYNVPEGQLDFYNFIPQISGDLFAWYGANLYPQYFLINSTSNGIYNATRVEPNVTAWPGNTNILFLRLQIGAQ
jgi:hypothetical protein